MAADQQAASLPDRVEAAADRLQHQAAAATPGTWAAVPITYDGTAAAWEIHAQAGNGVREDVVSHQTHEGGGIYHQADADYITALQPKVGQRLAIVLRKIAQRMRDFEAAGMPAASMADPDVIRLVDAILTSTEG